MQCLCPMSMSMSMSMFYVYVLCPMAKSMSMSMSMSSSVRAVSAGGFCGRLSKRSSQSCRHAALHSAVVTCPPEQEVRHQMLARDVKGFKAYRIPMLGYVSPNPPLAFHESPWEFVISLSGTLITISHFSKLYIYFHMFVVVYFIH